MQTVSFKFEFLATKTTRKLALRKVHSFGFSVNVTSFYDYEISTIPSITIHMIL